MKHFYWGRLTAARFNSLHWYINCTVCDVNSWLFHQSIASIHLRGLFSSSQTKIKSPLLLILILVFTLLLLLLLLLLMHSTLVKMSYLTQVPLDWYTQTYKMAGVCVCLVVYETTSHTRKTVTCHLDTHSRLFTHHATFALSYCLACLVYLVLIVTWELMRQLK